MEDVKRLRLVDCVGNILAEEHVEGMKEERGHSHEDEEEESHDEEEHFLHSAEERKKSIMSMYTRWMSMSGHHRAMRLTL